MDMRATNEKKRKRKDRVVMKDDRLTYAEDLTRQLRELSDPGREVKVTIGGDGASEGTSRLDRPSQESIAVFAAPP